MKQGEQEVLHARDRVGQTSGATQRCLILESARALGIRDAHVRRPAGRPASFTTAAAPPPHPDPRGICHDNSRCRRPFEAPRPIRSAAGCPPVVDAHNRCNGPRGDAVTGRLAGRAWAACDVAGGRGPVTRLEHGERPRRVRKRARRPAQGTAGSRRQAQRRAASSSPVPVTVRRSRRSSEESCARSPPGPTPRAPGRRAG